MTPRRESIAAAAAAVDGDRLARPAGPAGDDRRDRRRRRHARGLRARRRRGPRPRRRVDARRRAAPPRSTRPPTSSVARPGPDRPVGGWPRAATSTRSSTAGRSTAPTGWWPASRSPPPSRDVGSMRPRAARRRVRQRGGRPGHRRHGRQPRAASARWTTPSSTTVDDDGRDASPSAWSTPAATPAARPTRRWDRRADRRLRRAAHRAGPGARRRPARRSAWSPASPAGRPSTSSSSGAANHAGTTPMDLRLDALAAAAEVVLAVEALARDGAVRVRHLRSPRRAGRTSATSSPARSSSASSSATSDLGRLAAAGVDARARLVAEVAGRAGRRSSVTWGQLVAPVDAASRRRSPPSSGPPARRADRGARCRAAPATTPRSSAAAVPMGMIFVPSIGGVSHSPRRAHRARAPRRSAPRSLARHDLDRARRRGARRERAGRRAGATRPTRPSYPRDLVGYGADPPDPRWPGGARVAVSFVLNVEEGGESSVLHGDPASETFLSEIVGRPAVPRSPPEHGVALRVRHAGPASGACCGLFADRGLPLTVFAVARALQANPAVVDARSSTAATRSPGHGLRWISYQDVDLDTERAHLAEAVRIHHRAHRHGARSVGTRAATRPTRAGSWSSTAASSTTRTPTPTTCPYWVDVDGTAAPGRPVHARHQRHALRHAAGVQHRRPLLHLLPRRLRRPLRRGRDARRRCSRSGCTRRIIGRPGPLRRARAGSSTTSPRHDDVWICRARRHRPALDRHVPAAAGCRTRGA